MDAGTVLKWGLLLVAGIFAVRFVSALAEDAMNANVGEGQYRGPEPNGIVWLYPAGVYPVGPTRGRFAYAGGVVVRRKKGRW